MRNTKHEKQSMMAPGPTDLTTSAGVPRAFQLMVELMIDGVTW
jgi:hypothetical protein